MKQEISHNEVPAAIAELHKRFDSFDEKLSVLVDTKEEREERLLSAAEACKLFIPAISRLTLIRWTKADYLKEHRIGGRVYYKLSEIVAGAKHLEKYKNKGGVK